MKVDTMKVLRTLRNMLIVLCKHLRKSCACQTELLLTRCETCWNVPMRHACHAKRYYVTLETPSSPEARS